MLKDVDEKMPPCCHNSTWVRLTPYMLFMSSGKRFMPFVNSLQDSFEGVAEEIYCQISFRDVLSLKHCLSLSRAECFTYR